MDAKRTDGDGSKQDKKKKVKKVVVEKQKKRKSRGYGNDPFIASDSEDSSIEEKEFEIPEWLEQLIAEEDAADAFINGKKAENKVANPCSNVVFGKNLNKYANSYLTILRNSRQKFTWDDIKADDGDGFSDPQRKGIRAQAKKLDSTYFPPRFKNDCIKFPAQFIRVKLTLPPELKTSYDDVQFAWLDKEVQKQCLNSGLKYDSKLRQFNDSKKRYTWHHHYKDCKMQLVEMCIHDLNYHKGGREIWGGGLAARKPPKGNKRQKTTDSS